MVTVAIQLSYNKHVTTAHVTIQKCLPQILQTLIPAPYEPQQLMHKSWTPIIHTKLQT